KVVIFKKREIPSSRLHHIRSRKTMKIGDKQIQVLVIIGHCYLCKHLGITGINREEHVKIVCNISSEPIFLLNYDVYLNSRGGLSDMQPIVVVDLLGKKMKRKSR